MLSWGGVRLGTPTRTTPGTGVAAPSAPQLVELAELDPPGPPPALASSPVECGTLCFEALGFSCPPSPRPALHLLKLPCWLHLLVFWDHILGGGGCLIHLPCDGVGSYSCPSHSLVRSLLSENRCQIPQPMLSLQVWALLIRPTGDRAGAPGLHLRYKRDQRGQSSVVPLLPRASLCPSPTSMGKGSSSSCLEVCLGKLCSPELHLMASGCGYGWGRPATAVHPQRSPQSWCSDARGQPASGGHAAHALPGVAPTAAQGEQVHHGVHTDGHLGKALTLAPNRYLWWGSRTQVGRYLRHCWSACMVGGPRCCGKIWRGSPGSPEIPRDPQRGQSGVTLCTVSVELLVPGTVWG